MEIKRSGSQPSGKGPAEYFTGTVRVDPLFNPPAVALQRIGLPSHSVTSAIKTLAESEGARSGPREPRKATNFGFARPNNRNGG